MNWYGVGVNLIKTWCLCKIKTGSCWPHCSLWFRLCMRSNIPVMFCHQWSIKSGHFSQWHIRRKLQTASTGGSEAVTVGIINDEVWSFFLGWVSLFWRMFWPRLQNRWKQNRSELSNTICRKEREMRNFLHFCPISGWLTFSHLIFHARAAITRKNCLQSQDWITRLVNTSHHHWSDWMTLAFWLPS